ncbi:unnamed protein product [Fraxinus pennsylvanica]|uniref:Chlorophyllase n=1 Tax=Fraxinus pennsylvanica TaxID=56036 RepID=A0AAD2E4C1_9LAMI|nr:unnamed protein product [Fraxinus pennsylvanica]
MALATSRSSVFDQGSVEVNPFTVNTSDRSSPPTQLFIVAPVEENTYPVLLFCHGFCINNTWYSQLLQHISSHGYIVVAPQFYHCMLVSITKEIEIAAKVTDWLSTGLPQVLKEKVKPDLSKLALSGHSRGGKVAFALALGHAPTSLEFLAILGIDPVDGWSPSSRPEPKILTYVPHSFNLEIPIGIIGMGLGDQWKGVIPPFAPDGVNHAEFFNESKPPCCYFLAKEYGHCDMLDESKAYLASWVCKSGEGSKEDLRRAVGGIVVAFFNAYLGDESKDLKAKFKKPSLIYSSSLSPIIVDVNMESSVSSQSSKTMYIYCMRIPMTDRSNEEQMKVPDTASDNPAPASGPGAGARDGAKSASRAFTAKAARNNTMNMVTAALEIPKIAI